MPQLGVFTFYTIGLDISVQGSHSNTRAFNRAPDYEKIRRKDKPITLPILMDGAVNLTFYMLTLGLICSRKKNHISTVNHYII